MNLDDLRHDGGSDGPKLVLRQRQVDFDVPTCRIGVRTNLVSRVDEVLRNLAIKARQMDHQLGGDSEAGRNGTDVDAGIDRRIGWNRDLFHSRHMF